MNRAIYRFADAVDGVKAVDVRHSRVIEFMGAVGRDENEENS